MIQPLGIRYSGIYIYNTMMSNRTKWMRSDQTNQFHSDQPNRIIWMKGCIILTINVQINTCLNGLGSKDILGFLFSWCIMVRMLAIIVAIISLSYILLLLGPRISSIFPRGISCTCSCRRWLFFACPISSSPWLLALFLYLFRIFRGMFALWKPDFGLYRQAVTFEWPCPY